jgi:hypothetical protein
VRRAVSAGGDERHFTIFIALRTISAEFELAECRRAATELEMTLSRSSFPAAETV